MQRRLLFVDDEPVIRVTLAAILRNHGFEVSVAATVAEALQKITSEKFDVLLSDLNIGNQGDGLTVVSAMRRTQPEAVTMILTGFPAFETALEAIRQQVDDYIVKPADIPHLVSAIESKLANPPKQRKLPARKRVSMILQENEERIEELWLAAVAEDDTLSQVSLSKEGRVASLRCMLKEIIRAAQTYGEQAGAEQLRPREGHCRSQSEGWTAHMVFTEYCLLRRILPQIVQENLLVVNLSYLIPDLARANESLDEQAQDAFKELEDLSKSSETSGTESPS